MKYAEHLKKIFPDTNLHVEDLLLLESFQIKELIERVPQKEFTTIIRKYPYVHRFLVNKEPSIEPFITRILKKNKEIDDPKIIDEHCSELLWEIGELIIYNKYPETYDSTVKFTWNLEEFIHPNKLKNKIIADIGAGSGMLTILLSEFAKTVYAIEPLYNFRAFLREKLKVKNIKNTFVTEGYLDNIPLPDQSLDYLFTSNALGWNFDKEQQEIERVVKSGGTIIHLMRAFDKDAASPYHKKLMQYNYKFQQLDVDSFKAWYSKTMK